MKDLKYLSYFEDLLQEANNELVIQARSEGKKCVAYVCENTPEPLLNLEGIFSARLRAPRTSSMEMATYYLTSFLCEYSRALLERAMEGGYNFADCLIAPDGCSMINRCVENMELLHTMDQGKENFFYEHMEIPMKADDNGLNLFVLQCKNHILKPLSEKFGIDVSDAAIRKAVAEHNHVCADRYCYGSFPGRDPIVLTDGEDALTQVCRQYMYRGQCPRYMDQAKIQGRRAYVNALAKEYNADGIIYEQVKFCDPWAYERMVGSHVLHDDYGYQVLSIDRPYNVSGVGQLRTRVQAFVESLEIKKIQGGSK